MTHIEILLLGYDIMRLKYDLRVPIISGGMTFCRNSTERVQREREKEKEWKTKGHGNPPDLKMFIHVSVWSWLVLKPVDRPGSLFLWATCLFERRLDCWHFKEVWSLSRVLVRHLYLTDACQGHTISAVPGVFTAVKKFQFKWKFRWKMVKEPTKQIPSCNRQLCQTFHGSWPAVLAIEDLEGFEVPPLPRSDPSRYQGSAWLVHWHRTCLSKKAGGGRDSYKGGVKINPRFLCSQNVGLGISALDGTFLFLRAVNDLAKGPCQAPTVKEFKNLSISTGQLRSLFFFPVLLPIFHLRTQNDGLERASECQSARVRTFWAPRRALSN